jgi:hypothetical protein
MCVWGKGVFVYRDFNRDWVICVPLFSLGESSIRLCFFNSPFVQLNIYFFLKLGELVLKVP